MGLNPTSICVPVKIFLPSTEITGIVIVAEGIKIVSPSWAATGYAAGPANPSAEPSNETTPTNTTKCHLRLLVRAFPRELLAMLVLLAALFRLLSALAPPWELLGLDE